MEPVNEEVKSDADEENGVLNLEEVECLLIENCKLRMQIVEKAALDIRRKERKVLSSIEDRLGVKLDGYEINLEQMYVSKKK